MKKIYTRGMLTLAAIVMAVSSYAITSPSVIAPGKNNVNSVENLKNLPEVNQLSPEMLQFGLEEFLSLTPAKYREMTGKRLGLKKSIELKLAQKAIKKQMKRAAGDIPKGLYIVLAIFGLGWLAMGIMDDWSGNNWWVNLILTLLFWLPGLIHALIVMKDYYN